MYKNTSYSDNIVDAVSCDESESIAILVRTNDEVLTLYSQLMAQNLKAKYITSKNGFNLGDLIELRDFLDFWEHSTFEYARIKINEKYAHSKNYKLTCNVIDTFFEQYEDEIQRSEIHFQAVFREYLEEIEFDEFEQSRSRIIVSTMHKAKGKEFASVYVGLKENCIEDDYALRLIYVAVTRAKNQLHIHSKDRFLLQLASYADSVVHYEKYVKEPDRIVFIMGLGDLVLSNENAQRGIEKTQPLAGEQIQIIQTDHATFELVKNSVMIGKLSGVDVAKPERLCMKILQMQAKGYNLEANVEIEYVVLWSPKSDKEKSQRSYVEVLAKIFMIQDSSFIE